ncbi:MAG: PorT family protein [Flavobacteriales bacterium]|nr:PorT family protein [Flavobacteriales bacterium]
MDDKRKGSTTLVPVFRNSATEPVLTLNDESAHRTDHPFTRMSLHQIPQLACALALLFTSSLANGQAAVLVLLFGDKAATENFHFTLDAGLNLSNMPGVNGASASTGFYFGLGTYIRLNDNWAFTPEFKPVSPRGGKGFENAFVDTTGAVGSYSTRLQLGYIDVPLQLHRRVNERFYVRAGPQVSYRTSAKLATTGDLVGGDAFTVTKDIKEEIRPWELALPIDLGIVFSKPRGYKGIDIRLRYCMGLTEVFTANAAGISSTSSTFQFFLSFPFVNVE